ncbi:MULTISPECIES: helix-turn-helix domain-containing protein [Paraburkholderia]|uniref:helix-turn-helix domain-containing protein n=1 Tax=Paraburkholderia TaxID=1822464 RepID=UPI0038BDACD3
MTQSAISRCIRELEDAVDLRLFDRTTRQVQVTRVGENCSPALRHCSKRSRRHSLTVTAYVNVRAAPCMSPAVQPCPRV